MVLSQNRRLGAHTRTLIAIHNLACIQVNPVVHLMQCYPEGQASEVEPYRCPATQVTMASTAIMAGELGTVQMAIMVGHKIIALLHPKPESPDGVVDALLINDRNVMRR